jgi:hypothetical protein
MDSKLLRVIYVFEFLIALIAVYVVWSQSATQYHLDLMAWYWKLGIGFAAAYAVVKATAAALTGERAWNGRTLRWLATLLALAAAAGLVTYYYHLYEPADEEQPETQACAAPSYCATGNSSACNCASVPVRRISLAPFESCTRMRPSS